MIRRCVDAERVRELFNYDPETGKLTHRASRRGRRIQIGDDASTPKVDGYRNVFIDGGHYLAHRIAWVYVYGAWPTTNIDHINGVRSDNRITNLREATQSENCQNQRMPHSNNKSGYLGVCLHRQSGKWQAQIQVNGKKIYIGLYATAEEAGNAYLLAKRRTHEFCTI